MTLPKTGSSSMDEAKGDANSAMEDFKKIRQYVRIYYPLNCPKQFLPELIIRYRVYPVLDISEAGICFQVPRANILPDDILTGVIKFPDGSSVEFSGVVVRRSENQIALKLIVGIPYNLIAAEQVRLRNLEESGEISGVA